MPYIPMLERDDVAIYGPKNPGQLNYALSRAISWYLLDEKVSYQRLNEVLGVLEAVKQEFYRRVVAPYEDLKLKENGDVYHANLLSKPVHTKRNPKSDGSPSSRDPG